MSGIEISAAFDGGNIEVMEDHGQIGGLARWDLRIRPDNASDFFQWFHFRVTGAKDVALELRILNAGDAAYPKGWEDYGVCVSSDRRTWRRSPTTYADGVLTLSLTPHTNSVWLAYFAPYSHERHLDFVARVGSDPRVEYRKLGETVEGRSLDCLSVGKGPRHVWVIARQHPGETMAEWWMEGFADILLGDSRAAGDALDLMRFHIVPNMNPDGAALGNLRTNAAGANLNREWNVATRERSPEVLCVRSAMKAEPPELCLDVHGDEALPYNFIAACEGVPSFDADIRAQLDLFLAAFTAATKHFQTQVGYPVTPPGQGNLAMCTNYVAETHKCLAMTLEMPFKDDANHPDPEKGWSPERAAQLGRDTLLPMIAWAKSRG